ncbi:MAG: hypothetical protein PHY93_10190 [Bacteriovorax sp.]|nr:hypothetical protein [Bacteriovorax sp.]
MKVLIAVFLLAGFGQAAYSMPCDTGYRCVSSTGKYKIELQRCRYRNHINLLTTKINNIEVKDASLNIGWDGDSVLAFEINLPTQNAGAVKILTAELPQKFKAGILKVKYADSEPGPLTVIDTEKIFCKIEE